MLSVAKGIRVNDSNVTVDISEADAKILVAAIKAVKSGMLLNVKELLSITTLSEGLDKVLKRP